MSEHIRLRILTEGNCVDTDRELFARLDAGDQNLQPEALESCRNCVQLAECQTRIGEIAVALAELEVRETVIGGSIIRLESTSEPLVIDDPAVSLVLLRKSVREQRLHTAPPPAASAAWHLKPHLTALPETKQLPAEQQDTAILKFLGTVDRYATWHGTTREIDEDFIQGVGSLYLADVIEFLGLKVSKPILAALRHSSADYWQLRARFQDDKRVDTTNINQCFASDDPAGRIERYIIDLEQCFAVHLPRLCEKYGFDIAILNTMPSSQIQRACFYYPGKFVQTIEEWFSATRENINQAAGLDVEISEPTLSTYSIRADNEVLAATPSVRAEAVRCETGISAAAIAGLTSIRQAYCDKQIPTAQGDGRLGQEARLLLEALRVSLGQDPAYQNMDLRKAAKFIDISRRRYNNIADDALPGDLSFTLQLCRAYLQDARWFEERRFSHPYRLSKSHSPKDYQDFVRNLAGKDTPIWVIKYAFTSSPLQPESYLQNFVTKRRIIRERVVARIGYAPGVRVLNSLTQPMPRDPAKAADTFADRYIALQQEFLGNPYVQDWMIAAALAFWPRNPQKGVAGFSRFTKQGIYDWQLTLLEDGDLSPKLSAYAGGDPQELYTESPGRQAKIAQINTLLSGFSREQRLAVACVFGFPLPPDFGPEQEDNLCQQLGVDNLEEYVFTLIAGIGND